MKKKEGGVFVVSLDFELKWGGIFNDSVTKGFNVRTPYVEKIIPQILRIFMKYGIHATWAVVGAIGCESKDEAEGIIQSNLRNSYYEKLCDFILQIEDIKSYFRPDLVSQIANIDNQEIASHTFSHFCVSENTDAEKILREELEKSVISIGRLSNNTINTIVFPKNQVDNNLFDVIKENGFTVIRGKQTYKRFCSNNEIGRFIRFLDAYFPICGKSSYKKSDVYHDGIYDVRASRFWRTYEKKLFLFERLKLHRIKREMKHAAKHGEIYHLWFHPHNLATNIEFNIKTLEKIVNYYNVLNKKYGMVSCTMNECVLRYKGEQRG